MLIAAAVCPHPPLLVPEATGGPGPEDPELDRLRAACRQAVAALTAKHPDLIAVVGPAERTAEYPPGAAGSLRDFGVPFTIGPVPNAPADAPEALPLPLTIGKWLLSGGLQNTAWWSIASQAPPAECLELGEKLAALAPRVALLAMGDGPARRARNAPGGADPEASRYEDQVTAALAAADAAALAALDPRHDQDLFAAGRPAWQVLAGAVGRDVFQADLHYAAIPFEVAYFVATWRRRGPR